MSRGRVFCNKETQIGKFYRFQVQQCDRKVCASPKMSPNLLLALQLGLVKGGWTELTNSLCLPARLLSAPFSDDQCNAQKNEIKKFLICFYPDHDFLFEFNRLFGIP